jgi:hypothetical protein
MKTINNNNATTSSSSSSASSSLLLNDGHVVSSPSTITAAVATSNSTSARHVRIQEPAGSNTYHSYTGNNSISYQGNYRKGQDDNNNNVDIDDEDKNDSIDDDDDDFFDESTFAFAHLKPSQRKEAVAAERLSIRLLSIPDDDEMSADQIVRKSLRLLEADESSFIDGAAREMKVREVEDDDDDKINEAGKVISSPLDRMRRRKQAKRRFFFMIGSAIVFLIIALMVAIYFIATFVVGPPSQPVGAYQLIERQEGNDFFQYYTFYEGVSFVSFIAGMIFGLRPYYSLSHFLLHFLLFF